MCSIWIKLQSILRDVGDGRLVLVRIVADAALDQFAARTEKSLKALSLQVYMRICDWSHRNHPRTDIRWCPVSAISGVRTGGGGETEQHTQTGQTRRTHIEHGYTTRIYRGSVRNMAIFTIRRSDGCWLYIYSWLEGYRGGGMQITTKDLT